MNPKSTIEPAVSPTAEKPKGLLDAMLESLPKKVEHPRAAMLRKDSEPYILRCPRCDGEGAYVLVDPISTIFASKDWFAAYKPEGQLWEFHFMLCQLCAQKGIESELRVKHLNPPADASSKLDRVFARQMDAQFICGSPGERRFVTTRTQRKRKEDEARLEFDTVDARRAAQRQAKIASQV